MRRTRRTYLNRGSEERSTGPTLPTREEPIEWDFEHRGELCDLSLGDQEARACLSNRWPRLLGYATPPRTIIDITGYSIGSSAIDSKSYAGNASGPGTDGSLWWVIHSSGLSGNRDQRNCSNVSWKTVV